jgi:hypothetical protein
VWPAGSCARSYALAAILPTFLRASRPRSLSYTALKAFATSAGPADTHRKRMSADGTYKKRHYPEVNDSPLYRL